MYMKKSVGPISALIVGHPLIQLWSGGSVSHPASTRQFSVGGPGGEAPGSSEDLAFYNTKMIKTERLFVFLNFWGKLSHPA